MLLYVHLIAHRLENNAQTKWANHPVVYLWSMLLWFPICVKEKKYFAYSFLCDVLGWRLVVTNQICCYTFTTLFSCGIVDAVTMTVYFSQLTTGVTSCFPLLNMFSWDQQWPHALWYSKEWGSSWQPFPFDVFLQVGSVASDLGKV